MIIEMDLYSKIRLLYSEGESIRSIATRLGIARQTVRKYCEGNTHPDARKSYTRKSDVITKDVKAFDLTERNIREQAISINSQLKMIEGL